MDFAVVAALSLGLIFAFLNGFHDAGVVTGNAVITRSLTPRQALILSTVFNVLGALMGQGILMAVAATLWSLPQANDDILLVISSALVAGIAIHIVTYLAGLPLSSTNMLFGGLTGAGLAVGFTVDTGPSIIFSESLLALLLAPVAGLILAAVLTTVFTKALANSAPKPLFRRARQIDAIAVAAQSLVHGSLSAQKVGTVLAIAWAARHHAAETVIPNERPVFLIILVAAALGAGTFLSGWRVTRTVSKKFVRLDPVRAAISDAAATATMAVSALAFQLPASSSYMLVGSNLGTQLAVGRRGVDLRILGRIMVTFLLSMPATALLAGLLALPFAG